MDGHETAVRENDSICSMSFDLCVAGNYIIILQNPDGTEDD